MQSIRTRSTGKLYAELYPGKEISRDNFEEILGAMVRAELLSFADAVFEKDGKQIPTAPSALPRPDERPMKPCQCSSL
jgi:hypothetical protein